MPSDFTLDSIFGAEFEVLKLTGIGIYEVGSQINRIFDLASLCLDFQPTAGVLPLVLPKMNP